MPSVDFKEAESAEFQVSVVHTVIYILSCILWLFCVVYSVYFNEIVYDLFSTVKFHQSWRNPFIAINFC